MSPAPEPGGERWARSWTLVEGLSVRFVDSGEPGSGGNGRAPLVVIPGHTARIEGFDEMFPLLAARRRVIVLDLPGCGESDKPDRRYDLEFYENIIVGLLDQLGIDAAVPVGGSLGGNLVLRLGHRFPDRFPVLVLWAPGGAWRARPRLATLVRKLGRRSFWPSVWIQSRYWYDRDFPGRRAALDETFAYYRGAMSPGFVRMYWGIAADQIGHSLFDIAPGITQSTLLMWGDHDNGAGMGNGVARLHSLIAASELKVFPGRRHSLEAEIPGELAASILEYLDREVDRRSGPAAGGGR